MPSINSSWRNSLSVVPTPSIVTRVRVTTRECRLRHPGFDRYSAVSPLSDTCVASTARCCSRGQLQAMSSMTWSLHEVPVRSRRCRWTKRRTIWHHIVLPILVLKGIQITDVWGYSSHSLEMRSLLLKITVQWPLKLKSAKPVSSNNVTCLFVIRLVWTIDSRISCKYVLGISFKPLIVSLCFPCQTSVRYFTKARVLKDERKGIDRSGGIVFSDGNDIPIKRSTRLKRKHKEVSNIYYVILLEAGDFLYVWLVHLNTDVSAIFIIATVYIYINNHNAHFN